MGDVSELYAIEFDNVSFTYPGQEKTAIQNLSLTIPAGCQAALVGSNGVGKSTLIKLLCRLYTPQSGCIRLGGIDIQNIPMEQYYRLLSVVLQTGSVLPYTILDNVTLSTTFDSDKYRSAMEETGFRSVADRLSGSDHTFILRQREHLRKKSFGFQRQIPVAQMVVRHDGITFVAFYFHCPIDILPSPNAKQFLLDV